MNFIYGRKFDSQSVLKIKTKLKKTIETAKATILENNLTIYSFRPRISWHMGSNEQIDKSIYDLLL